MYGVTLSKGDILLPTFFYRCQSCDHQKSVFLSNFTPNSFSVSLLSILNPSTFILTLSFVLTNKLHLSSLHFKRLFLNHSNKLLDACSRNVNWLMTFINWRITSSAGLLHLYIQLPPDHFNLLRCFLQVLTLFSIRLFRYSSFLLFSIFCLVLTPSNFSYLESSTS